MSNVWRMLSGLLITLSLVTIGRPALPAAGQLVGAEVRLSAGKSQPEIPLLLTDLYLGVPVGNGTSPQQVAIDSQHRRVYTLNNGQDAVREGNTISVFDIGQRQFVALVRLNNMREFNAPYPLDIQVDPYRPRLYALAGDRYADTPDTTLSIVDTQTWQVIASLPGVEAVAPGPDRLYLVNDTRLWTLDPDSLQPLANQDLEVRRYNDFLLLNAAANRLYLGRGKPWTLQALDANTLEWMGEYRTRHELIAAVVDDANDQLVIAEYDGKHPVLRALSADANLLAQPPPLVLDSAFDVPMSAADGILYVGDGDYTAYRLRRFRLPDLQPLPELPLAYAPNDMAFDPIGRRLWAVYTNCASTLEAIDVANGQAEMFYSALEIEDAVVDPVSSQLYVLDEGGTLRVFDPPDYRESVRVATYYSAQRACYSQYGRLAIDPELHRLYISGPAARTVDTQSYQVTIYPGVDGQLTPDPTSDRVYLTPPCMCRQEPCNTLILNATTMTGTQKLYPEPSEMLSAPCPYHTQLDAQNQLLYVRLDNGVPGSNSGTYFSVYDVSGQPREVFTQGNISYGHLALDSARQRAFVPRYRIDASFIECYQVSDQSVSLARSLVGASGWLAYDVENDRLYVVNANILQVFDADLALLAEVELPGRDFQLLDLDPRLQRLYLRGASGHLLVMATSGGRLTTPLPPPEPTDYGYMPAQQLAAAPDDTLFRLFNGRVYRSQDDGQTWQLLGQGLPNRSIGALAVSPNYRRDHTLLAGIRLDERVGGLYRSTDGGESWLPITRGLSDLGISEIVFSPTFRRDRTIFVTTRQRGLFRSMDGGDTWTSLADRYAQSEYEMSMSHPALSPNFYEDELLFATYRDRLWRSTDAGDSWQDTHIPGGVVAFSPEFDRDGLIVNSGVWRSQDGGQTWHPSGVGIQPSESGARAVFFSPNFAVDHTIYLLLNNGSGQPYPLQRSVDGGRSWQTLLGGLPQDFTALAAATILSNGELWLSTPDGRTLLMPGHLLTWGELGAAAPQPLDLSSLEIDSLAAAPDGTLFIAHSQAGVYKSTDAGQTWQMLDFPVRGRHVDTAHLALAADGTLFAALGGALERSHDGGQSWEHLSGLPAGFEVASLAISPDYVTDGIVLVGGRYNNRQLARSADRGQTWQIVFDGHALEGASDIPAIAFSPNFAYDGTVYAWLQDGGLLRSNDRGQNWVVLTGDISQIYLESMTVSPDGARLYLGALYGDLLVSSDQGKSWLNLSDRVPGERVWSKGLAFDAQGALYLATDVGIYRSLDGGQSWQPASAGLPVDESSGKPTAVKALVLSDERLYAAVAYHGLFFSDDQGESWYNTASGQPASPVEPTPTPIPSPVASPTPVVPVSRPATPEDCPTRPTYFEKTWQARFAQLGCPLAWLNTDMVEQTFEGGRMFWRSDTRAIYVLPARAPFSRYQDSWDESQPEYTCADDQTPAQTPPTPHRGFGKVWCLEPSVRQQLGNATSQEHVWHVTLQEFESGLVFATEAGALFVLEDGSGNWEQFE